MSHDPSCLAVDNSPSVSRAWRHTMFASMCMPGGRVVVYGIFCKRMFMYSQEMYDRFIFVYIDVCTTLGKYFVKI